MLDEEHKPIYLQLWRLSDREEPPVPVSYELARFNLLPPAARDADGLFMTTHPDATGPQIWIRRDPVPEHSLAPELDQATIWELLTLAHERGHERSWRDGTYEVGRMSEERRAWGNAKEILRKLGFPAADWDRFETAEREALKHHAAIRTPE